MKAGFYSTYGKRAFDIAFASFALLASLPIIVLVFAALRFSIGKPVIFKQARPGLRGRAFIIFKFRTMMDRRDPNGKMLPDEQRITAVGRIIRSMSLDELPEIVNVLKGDMSIVGPRPLMMQYLNRYTQVQARRHEVMPGITGWVQVNGRNALTWDEKFELDVWYVDHQSFHLDLKILAMTLWKVMRKQGISEKGYVAASEFMGSHVKSERSIRKP